MAYALEPLIQILELTDPNLIQDVKPQFDSLLAKSLNLRRLLGRVPEMTNRSELAKLETRIRDASHEAEDILEPFVTGRVLSRYEGLADDDAPELSSLADVEERLDSVSVDLKELIDSGNLKDAPPLREPAPVMKTRVVGFADILENLRKLLAVGNHRDLCVIPLVGMGGSGKTTLAEELFANEKIDSHFEICGWVTISQQFDSRATLLALLDSLHKLTNEMQDETDQRLGDFLYQTLIDKRYFIVVDDIWGTDVWDKLNSFFPNKRNGSRIMVTTRQGEVAEYVKLSCDIVQKMRFLHKDESFELLCDRVFGNKPCPTEFADIGQRIAQKCKGLPLAVIVIAGLLVSSERTLEFWELIEESVGSTVMEDEKKHFKEVLSLSYNYLPYYLKPCFMYLGAFPEDAAIRCSRLIYLWVAEGFLTPFKDKNWEDTAETYIKALIERNLIFPRRHESTGKVITFGIHDMLRSLCHETASAERFFWFKNKDVDIVRRVGTHPSSELSDKKKVILPARSFVCVNHASIDLAAAFFDLKLLRVLDVFDLQFLQFPRKLLKLVNLRYLAFSSYADLPASFSRFRYLRNIIIRRQPSFRSFTLPADMWGMTQLRHIKSKENCIWHFPTDDQDVTILENLMTLSNIQTSGMTSDVLKRFPNLRKLGICCNDSIPHDQMDLALLEKLETLKCTTDWSVAPHKFLFSLTLPLSLKKLTLCLCKIPKEFMDEVAELPNLQHLKLEKSDFLGPNGETTEAEWVTARPTWELPDDGFQELISLVMIDLNLVFLEADSSSFPVLERLIVRECCSLQGIPEDIGRIATLELIEVDESSPPVLASVKEIQKQQEEIDNISFAFSFYSAF